MSSNCLSVKFTETENFPFKSRLLFDASDIIPVVEFNLDLPNILRDVVVYFTTLNPLILFLSNNLSDLYLVEESTDCAADNKITR
jgi:hypothetical protein